MCIVVDYPPEEAVESSAQLKVAGIDPIFLVTPTTTDARIAAIAAQAAGFLYYVSLKGITGAGHLDVAAVASRLPVIRRYTGLPVAVGFGIRDAANAQAVAQCSRRCRDRLAHYSRKWKRFRTSARRKPPNSSSPAFESRSTTRQSCALPKEHR